MNSNRLYIYYCVYCRELTVVDPKAVVFNPLLEPWEPYVASINCPECRNETWVYCVDKLPEFANVFRKRHYEQTDQP